MDKTLSKVKSKRNKTIDFSVEEGKDYISLCLKEEEIESIDINKVIIGDTFSAVKKIKDNSIDLLIVDPPYNLIKYYHGLRFNKTTTDLYEEYTNTWIELVKPKLKQTASIYVCCDWQSSYAIGKVLEKHFILRNRITWEREKGRGARSNWKNSMEDIYYATVGENYTFNLNSVKIKRKVLAPYRQNGKPKDWKEENGEKFRLTCPSNFWNDISVPYWSMAENTAHPTQKPEKLIAKLILASSNKNDLVVDIFSGSGTTGVVAKKLSRNYILIEQNPMYCGWAQKRLEDAEKNKTIQGYNGSFFLPRQGNQ